MKELIAEAKKRGIITLVDGAQAIAHLHMDVQDLGCDLYAFSGHKATGRPASVCCTAAKNCWSACLPGRAVAR